MQYGLERNTILQINSIFSKYTQIKQVLLYGSRAKDSFKKSSDIDLCIVSDNLDLKSLYQIEDDLDNLLLPYKIDISVYSKLNNEELKLHIKRVGKVFYEYK